MLFLGSGQPAHCGSLGNTHQISQISMRTDCNNSHSACLPGFHSPGLPWQVFPPPERREAQEHAPATASAKNDDFPQNCLAFVLSSTLKQNFLFLYHFQVDFISAQGLFLFVFLLVWVLLFCCFVFVVLLFFFFFSLLCMCAKRILTKDPIDLSPYPCLPFVSPHVTAVPAMGRMAVTQQQNRGLKLTDF